MTIQSAALRGLFAAALGTTACAAHAVTSPLVCAPGASYCTIDLPHVTLRFDAAPSGHAGVFENQFGETPLIDPLGFSQPLATVVTGDAEGFSFGTYYGNAYAGIRPDTRTGQLIGNDGFTASISLFNVSFVAKDGYRVDQLELSFTGYASTYNNGSASVWIGPGGTLNKSTSSTGDSTYSTYTYHRLFEGTDTGRIDMQFVASAAFTGVGGEASAGMRSFTVLAQVSAVPEPATWLPLALGGVLAVGAARQRRR